MEDYYKYDLYRYYGEHKPSLLHMLIKPLELRYIKWYRYCQKHKHSLFAKYYLRKLSKKTHIQIPPNVNIGPGFYILHFGRIIVNHNVTAGINFTICPGTLIGQEERGERRGCPSFGNNVFLGNNACVVGKITIGDDVLISPNAYVNFNVPSHSIVIGNPGVIIHKEAATYRYIKHQVSIDDR